MKSIILFCLSIAIIGGCSLNKSQKQYAFKCHELRGALDIGSGSTKFLMAKVDRCKNILLGILKEKRTALKFKESLHLNKGRIPESLIQEATTTITEIIRDSGLTPGEVRGVATEVFREAINGSSVVDRIGRETGVSLKLIDQRMEAQLGFWAAVGMTGKEPNKILVWDIGGGSMQISAMRKGHLFSYLGKLASVSFKDYILKLKDLSRGTPNPIGSFTGLQAFDYAQDIAKKEVPVEIKQEANDREVLGIGGVHFLSVRNQLNLKEGNPYSLFRLLEVSNKRVNWSDGQFESLYKETEASNLLLVGAFMKALGIDTVLPVNVNLATGVIFDRSLW